MNKKELSIAKQIESSVCLYRCYSSSKNKKQEYGEEFFFELNTLCQLLQQC